MTQCMNAVRVRAGDRKGRPYGAQQEVPWAGRCGERTERCRWQRKRSERVAAVKILSVRRKAAQKFWAPQQDHRPLRKRNKRCNGRATARVAPMKFLPIEIRRAGPACPAGSAGKESPSHGFAVPASFRQGGLGTGDADCHSQCMHWLRNDTLYEMRYESGRATARVAPTELVVGTDRGVCPYGCIIGGA